jgi:hypothetical protein
VEQELHNCVAAIAVPASSPWQYVNPIIEKKQVIILNKLPLNSFKNLLKLLYWIRNGAELKVELQHL